MGIVKDKLGDIMVLSWETMMLTLDNLITGLAEKNEVLYNKMICDNLREIAERHLPFNDKIDELKMAVNNLGGDPNEPARLEFLNELDDLAEKGVELKEGVDEVKRLIQVSGMSRMDKNQILDALDTCERSMKDYYCTGMPPYVYKKFMAVIRRANVQADISILEQKNGSFIIFYPAQHRELIDHALELGTLSYQQYPSVNAVERAAYMGAIDPNNATVLKFENLTPEFAERALQEARRYGLVDFAKEKIPQSEPERYRLVCEGGSTHEERDRNYREALEILARTAVAMSGPAKTTQETKMRFDANQYDRLQKGLESGHGYVFSVRDVRTPYHSKDPKEADITKLDITFDPRNFLYFETDEKSGRGQFYTQKDGVITTTVYESETERYDRLLYHTANAGLGNKIYISNERIEELKDAAARVHRELNGNHEHWHFLKNEKESTISAKIDALDDAFREKRDLYKATKDNSIPLAAGIKQESIDIAAVKNAMVLVNQPDFSKLTEEDIFYGMISEEINEKHIYKVHDQGRFIKEHLEAESAINKMTAWCAKDTREEAAITTTNRMRVETVSQNEDFSMNADRIVEVMNRFDPDMYIAHEFEHAQADHLDEYGNPIPPENGVKTVSQVRQEAQYLKQYYEPALKQAKELLKDVRVHTVEARMPLACHNMETRYTKLVHLAKNQLLDELDITKPTDMAEHTRPEEREMPLDRDVVRREPELER